MGNSTDKIEQACQQQQQQEQKQKQMRQHSSDFNIVRKTIQIPRKPHKGKTQPGEALFLCSFWFSIFVRNRHMYYGNFKQMRHLCISM
jgi:hypothetical protein